jgi:hypothetical protein
MTRLATSWLLDDLALLVPHVLGNDALATEEQPLRELIELLALAGGRVNRAAQLNVPNVVQQELGSNDPPELAKGKVELVLRT